MDELCVNIKNRYRNLVYLCFPEYEELFKGNSIYSNIALEFIGKYPHADIISNTRIDALQNFFKKYEFRYWKVKAILIKETAINSYPSVNMNDELVSNLSQIARLINEYQKAIEIIKYKIIFLATNIRNLTNYYLFKLIIEYTINATPKPNNTQPYHSVK